MIKILAVCGSLRKDSYNNALLKAMQALAPRDMEVTLFSGLADIPPFNPDRDPSTVAEIIALKALLVSSDGLFISSPEYAHGISGVLKNALDWLVSGEEFIEMPVAIFNTSPRAHHALASLHEIIRTMSGRIVTDACMTVPLLGTEFDAEGIIADRNMVAAIEQAFGAFRAYLNGPRILLDVSEV
ncbi:NADPH-dependent FMN reductase [Shewanella sedimentimangrovi]|uniref:NAD(P)H-dependent oxidoreductase n=1 Tax=Shewanella sedimentimangrovi TaxID=2814293 RepID=A0ABX7QXL8_9GAMM|nr:NADPH-dependent FMN reductase [Shewanella sedimentimangrovi]QSX36269.1 NAD(P)H-dependent oxidoreductase [Shewanella sedimentimangrovi]